MIAAHRTVRLRRAVVPSALAAGGLMVAWAVAAGSAPARGASEPRVIDLATESATMIAGATGKDQLGNDLRAGDVDGDGVSDLFMGAHWGSVGGRNIVGRAYGLRGRAEWPPSIDLANRLAADWWVMGVGSEARMGSAIASGDLSGDGIADFVIGSLLANPFESALNANVGAVYAILGAEGGGGRWDLLNTEPDIIVGGGRGTGGGDQLGTDLELGDFDGDGAIDLLAAAAHRDERKGAVFWWRGPLPGGTRIDGVTEAPDGLVEGVSPNGYLGSALAAGDLNADGVDDLAIGVLGLGELTPESNGAVVVFFGGPELPERHALESAPAPLTIVGRPFSSLASAFSAGRCSCRGRSIAVADLTGDGVPDLVIGAVQGADRRGLVHVVPGPLGPGTTDLAETPHLEIVGTARDSRFGWSVETGDLDADGVRDLVIAAPFVDVGDRSKAGQVFGFRGPLPITGTIEAGSAFDLRVDGRSEGDGDAGITLVLTDTDGDGLDDLHMGFPDGDPGGKLSVGEVHRLAGPILERPPTATATPTPTVAPTESATATPSNTAEPPPTAGPTDPTPPTATATAHEATTTPTGSEATPSGTAEPPPGGRHRIAFPVLVKRY